MSHIAVYKRGTFFLMLLGLFACTNSEWLLSPVYDRLDNILVRETKEYADFSAEQVREMNLLADQYHLWHRTNHLPAFVEIMREVHAMLVAEQQVELSHVEDWSARIEFLLREMGTCHPINSAQDTLRELSDEQIEQILAHGIEEHEEFVEDYIDMPTEDYIDKRYRVTKKWLVRLGLSFNKEQKAQLRKAIATEKMIDPNLWKHWHEEFVAILREREADNFNAVVSDHLSKLWRLQDDQAPEEVAFNKALWNQYFADYALSQTPKQRARFASWLKKMSSSLEGISENVNKGKIEKLRIAQVPQTCQINIPVVSE